MSEWQPIETAPRDGTWFLAYRGAATSGAWDTLVPIAWSTEVGDFVWPDSAFDPYTIPPISGDEQWLYGDFYESRGSFTHWMPLPETPNGAGKPEVA